MRATLARLLLQRPSLLLLDEPTNHLDIESLEWLESFLADYEGTVVIVSHDRYFLNRMVTSIAELGPSGLTVYPGDYDEYLVRAGGPPRAARGAGAEPGQAHRRDRAVHRALPVPGDQGASGAEPRQDARAHRARARSRRDARVIRFAFPQPPRTGRRVATLAGGPQGVRRQRRVRGRRLRGRAGRRAWRSSAPNGAGKSTLLRMLAGVLPSTAGERTLGAHVAVHYYAQHQLDALDADADGPRGAGARGARSSARHGCGRSWAPSCSRATRWRRRSRCCRAARRRGVALAKMLVRPAALLCLDEPTNHLDLASREVLEEALAGVPGHDRVHLPRSLLHQSDRDRGASRSTRGDARRPISGSYDDYLDAEGPRRRRGRRRAPPPGPAAAARGRRDRSRPRASRRRSRPGAASKVDEGRARAAAAARGRRAADSRARGAAGARSASGWAIPASTRMASACATVTAERKTRRGAGDVAHARVGAAVDGARRA